MLKENWFNVFQAAERHRAALVRYMQVILRKLQERHQPLRHHGHLHMILLLAEVVQRYSPFVATSSQVVQEKVMKKLVCGRKKPYYKERRSTVKCFWRCGAEAYKFASQKAPTLQKTTLPNGPHVVCQIWKHAAGSHPCLIQAIQYLNKRAFFKKSSSKLESFTTVAKSQSTWHLSDAPVRLLLLPSHKLPGQALGQDVPAILEHRPEATGRCSCSWRN